nr:MAG: hypothetical protein [Bacteriophage sp.]
MAGSQVTYTRRNIGEIVNKLDPKRLSEPQVVYVFDNGKTIKELPDLPGQDYRWVKDIPDV